MSPKSRSESADVSGMSERPNHHPADAEEAVSRLEATLETIRASSANWPLSAQSAEELGALISEDPRCGEIIATALHERMCRQATAINNLNALQGRIEETLDTFRKM